MRGNLALVALVFAPCLAGFDFFRHSVPPTEIVSGGPPKDGIPAIVEPRFVSAEEASFLDDRDRVIGVVRRGVARAYPIKILNWHEVVNDRLEDRSIAVTY
jgi:hypothetical protein